ncbi:hypothetical protein MTR67_008285, partial [Solanum verrucosum]
KDWLPLPYFYLDGEALTWFMWLHRNKQFFDWKYFKEKLLMRFPQRTTSVSMADTFRAYIDYIRYTTFVPPTNSPSAVVDLSPVTYSSDLKDAFTSGNTEADHMLEKLPEKYTNVDSLALLTRSDAEIATLECLGTPQIGMQNQFCKDISMQTKFPTSVLTYTKESNSVEEKKSLDDAALFDKSPQRDASGTLAPFTKQAPVLSNMHIRITEIVYPIATWVSLLIPLVGREDMMSNEHLEQDMVTRYVVINSLGSDPPKWKTDLGTFTVGRQIYFLMSIFWKTVWDPGQLECVKSNWFKVFSIVDKCNSLTCPLIAYSLVFAEYYMVWEVKVSRRLYKVKVVYSACYTLYGVIEIVESAASHKLHHGLGNALVFVILLNKCVVARDAHAYSNLEDKVLIGVGSIVMNGPRPVLAKRPNTKLSGYVWDPG